MPQGISAVRLTNGLCLYLTKKYAAIQKQFFSLCLRRSLRTHFTTYKKTVVTHTRSEDRLCTRTHKHLLSRLYEEVFMKLRFILLSEKQSNINLVY